MNANQVYNETVYELSQLTVIELFGVAESDYRLDCEEFTDEQLIRECAKIEAYNFCR